MASIEDTFRATLSNFKKRLTPKEQDDFSFSTLEDVRKEVARIQLEQGSQKMMMNMTRLQSFLEAMDQFGQVIEVFLNASEFVAFIWGPLKFILQVASTWADSFDTLLNAYEQIGEQIPLLQQYQAVFEHSPHMKRVLEMIYSDILEFHKRALRFFSERVWRQVFRSVWKDFKTRFQNILDRLRRHREVIESQANLLHFQQYQLDRAKMLEDLYRSENERRQKNYKEALEWISGADANLDHESACAARSEYPGSGRWILKHSKLQNWKEADAPVSSILWLNGIPGAGKTILASVIIEDCLDDPSFKTSFFYCKHGDPEKNNCTSIFKGLLKQLIWQCRDLVPFCHDKYSASGELTLTSANSAKQLVELFCQRISRQHIIIDGLDECDITERKLVMLFFSSLVDRFEMKEPGKLRVLFVSQDENDIRKGLTTAAWIPLDPKDNAKDIKTFVHKWSVSIQEKFELDNESINYIKESTCFRAQGMFLFAKLVMVNLFAQTTREQLLEETKPSRFPNGLEQAYERIMRRIKLNSSASEWKLARRLLGWMVCARRPLKWREIQAAVSTDPTSQTINFNDRQLRIHIRDICGSLIQVLPGDRVELVHITAKFYITTTGSVHTPLVQCNLAALCLQYLTFVCFDVETTQEQLRDLAVQGYFVFQDYAVANWSHHLSNMVEIGHQLFAESLEAQKELHEEVQEAVQELNDALWEFTSHYDDDLLEEPIDDSSEESCQAFRRYGFYYSLQLVWSHAHLHQQKDFEARNDVSLKALGNMLVRNRKLLEDLTSSPTLLAQEQENIAAFYGDKRYKCPKVTCYYFHEGFKDAKSRELHINRHDRPFRCAFPDCSVTDFGFGSSKELEKHARLFHPSADDMGMTFAVPKAVPVATSKWACHICSKRFTRRFHLTSHIRAHNAERPYACSECGKAFTRSNDCRRHEKIHARR